MSDEKRILVADKLAEAGLAILRDTPGITFDIRQGLSPDELAGVIGDYDGILIRSAVKLTKEVLANPGRLAAIARAGVGVDNVDLDAATAAGVLVLNTPDANTISTAEHTLAVMLALFRRIPDAHAHVRAGEWKRSAFQGDQLAGKTLGIVGLGRIGREVARRALAFEMNVLAFDPFIGDPTALQGEVRMVEELDELLPQVDCLTLHASLSDQTRRMIGKDQLARMKPTARLVNCARGALVDEQALADALNEGIIAGAAIDVYEHEPPQGSPLLTARNVVLTPHLAASTVEAQTRVSTDAVEALLAYLLRGEIRSAVNVAGLPARLTPRARAFVDLCARMGGLLSPWCRQGVKRVHLRTSGETLDELAGTLAWQGFVSVLEPHLDTRLNLVNARDQARSRGIRVDHASHPAPTGFTDSVTLRVETGEASHEVEGTVFADGRPRVLSIDGYRMELVPEGPMVLIFNDDQPGVIGLVGQKVGQAGINIADMALSRRDRTALMVLKLDTPMPAELLDELRATSPPIRSVHTVSLPPAADGPARS
ncbi:MAG: phosphoglycerate dehydrogenase [Planctomycetota bacterium]|nr:MAG: phosphoglycerate dehydrogenase [Planctomycetota bacterium]